MCSRPSRLMPAPRKERGFPDLGGAEVMTRERQFRTMKPSPNPRLGELVLKSFA